MAGQRKLHMDAPARPPSWLKNGPERAALCNGTDQNLTTDPALVDCRRCLEALRKIAEHSLFARWREVGREAFRCGESAAPTLNAAIRAAVANLSVGDPAATTIMRGYSQGWHAENLAARVEGGSQPQ